MNSDYSDGSGRRRASAQIVRDREVRSGQVVTDRPDPSGRQTVPDSSSRQTVPDPSGRQTTPGVLDAVDRKILQVLAADARTPNNALAAEVGVAPSTCLGRVRALRAGGVIRGFHADIDPAALGRPLQAMIAVRLQAGARSRMVSFTDRIRKRPEVVDLYFLAGANDFLLHVAAADAVALRDFVVDQLSAYPEVALTETNLIFEHLRGAGPA